MIYKNTVTKSVKHKRERTFAIGRDDKLEGKPVSLDGYQLWELCDNYDGAARDGNRKTWRYLELKLSRASAIDKLNKLVGYKALTP